MAIEHVDIGSGEIHEPKGVGSAIVGQVYIADGAASGAWGYPSVSANTVSVSSASDFPSPVAGVITLAASTTYLVSGAVNIGTDRLVFSLNSKIKGYNRFTDGVVYTGTSTMWTATTTHAMEEMFLTCSSGTAMSLSGTGTALYTNAFITDCDALGTVTAFSTLVWRSFSVVSVTNATNGKLAFSGACTALNMDNSFWGGFTAGDMIDFGSATFDRIQINGGNRFLTTSGVTAVRAAASCANLNAGGRGLIVGAIFEGAGTYTSGLDKGDVCWTFNSIGIPKSEKDADIYTHSNATGTSATTTPTKVLGTWSESEASQFTTDASGRMTYIGKDATGFSVNSTVFAAATSGSSQRYFFYIAKNGTILTSSKSTRDFTTSTPGSLSVTAHLDMEENDYVELFVEKDTGSDTITVIDEHTVISQVN